MCSAFGCENPLKDIAKVFEWISFYRTMNIFQRCLRTPIHTDDINVHTNLCIHDNLLFTHTRNATIKLSSTACGRVGNPKWNTGIQTGWNFCWWISVFIALTVISNLKSYCGYFRNFYINISRFTSCLNKCVQWWWPERLLQCVNTEFAFSFTSPCKWPCF